MQSTKILPDKENYTNLLHLRMFIRNKSEVVLLSFVTLIGALLRFIGIRWWLPFKLHPDEFAVIDSAIEMIERRSFEPAIFLRPDHLEIKINSLLFNIYSIMTQFKFANNVFEKDIVPFYLIARGFSAFLGTAMIPLSYFILERIKPKSGIYGAVIFAIFPSFVEHSHYATPDIPLGFMVLLFIYLSLNYIEKQTYINLTSLCVVTGLAITIKYPAAILGLVIALYIVYFGIIGKNLIFIIYQGLFSIILTIVSIFSFSPVLFTNIEKVVSALSAEANPEHLGADGLGYLGNIFFYAQQFTYYSGLIFLIFVIIGFAYLIKSKNKIILALLTSFIFWLCLSYIGLHWERWAVPMYFSPLLLGAIGISISYDWYINNKIKNHIKLKRVLIIVTIIIVLVNLLVGSLVELEKFIIPDTRIASYWYCLANDITLENSIYEGYTPFNMGKRGYIFEQFNVSNGNISIINNNSDKKYIVLSSKMYSRYFNEPERYKEEIKIYNHIQNRYQLVKSFNSQDSIKSTIDVVSIYNNLSKIVSDIRNGCTGSPILIYKISK